MQEYGGSSRWPVRRNHLNIMQWSRETLAEQSQMSARAVLLLRLMEDVVRYLDLSGQLPALEQAGRGHESALAECRPVLRFSVGVDVLRLIHLSGYCGRLLLAEPLVARDVIQKVVHLSLEALVPQLVLGRDQVQITVRLETFSSTSLLTRGPQLTGLVLMKGVLVARTTAVKYICSSVYCCPTPGCGNRVGTRRAGATLLQGARCRHCGECLEELPRGRETGDQVQGYLLAPEALRGRRAQPLPPVLVCFQDDLAEGLEMGACYSVVGSHDRRHLLAWQVWRQPPRCGPPAPLPRSVSQLRASLLESCPECPWALVFSLAARLAPHLYPAEAFLHLKMGLLLSLASQDGSTPVPVLAVGEETLPAHHLLEEAGLLAERCVAPTSPGLCAGLGGSSYTDEAGARWSEAGPLLLAASGVCNLGDWAALRQPALRSYLFSVLESGSVAVEVEGPGTTVLCYPLRSAVWTYTSLPAAGRPVKTAQLKTLIDAVSSVFGIPFLAEAGCAAERVAQHVLRAAVGGQRGQESVPPSELREYVETVKCRPVKLSDAAGRLIRNYFVASRRLRPQCLPVGATNTITRLSEACARLDMQREVSRAHVLAVLYLYEEAMARVFGPSPAAPHLPASAYLHLPLLAQINGRLKDFSEWVDRHLSLLGEFEE